MALTLEAEQKLTSVGLIGFFDDERERWKTLAQGALTFVTANFPPGSTVRHDDVAAVLVPILDVEPLLTDFLNEQKLKQRYWRRHFCDLILDRCWTELTA
jgi:hypothetical protein